MAAKTTDLGLWHTAKDPDERAKRLRAVVQSLDNDQEARKRRILRDLRRLEGRNLPDLTPTAYYHTNDRAGWDSNRIQLPRAVASTAVAKIAGKQKPKACFAVSDGDWATKRKAKKMEKAVEAVMQMRQGLLQDGYAVLLEAFKDCCYADCGVVKWEPDYAGKRVVLRRVLPWQFLVDPKECGDGMAPLNFFENYGLDRIKLADTSPSKFRDKIMAAPSISDVQSAGSRDGSTDRHGRRVLVQEGYRVALGPDLPGVHTVAVGGVDLTEGEDWEWTFPPYEIMTWEPWRIGILGASLVEISGGCTDEFNSQFERWSQAERLGSNMYGVCEEDSIREEDLRSNKQMTWLRHKKGSAQPTIQVPQTMGAASIQWMQMTQKLSFDIPGVSQADAQSEREPGLQSGEAQRIVATIKSERFAPQWQMYERVCAVGSARQILRCLKQLADDGAGDVVIRSGAGGQMREFSYKDFALELPDESIQIAAVSGLVDTPADRVDIAERLLQLGAISIAGFRRVIQAKDIDRELDAEDAQSRLVEKYINSWLDPTTKAERAKFEYRPPKKWMNLPECIIQVGRALFEAEVNDAPDWNMQWFVKFLGDCDRVMQQIAAQQAQLQAAASGSAPALGAIGPMAGGGPAPGSPPPGAGGPPPPVGLPGPGGPGGPGPAMAGRAA